MKLRNIHKVMVIAVGCVSAAGVHAKPAVLSVESIHQALARFQANLPCIDDEAHPNQRLEQAVVGLGAVMLGGLLATTSVRSGGKGVISTLLSIATAVPAAGLFAWGLVHLFQTVHAPTCSQ